MPSVCCYHADSADCSISTSTVGRSTESSTPVSGSEFGSDKSVRPGQSPMTNNHHSRSQQGSPDNIPYKMPNMEQWLALRVHGGARNWPKLPSCFNAAEP